MAMTLRNILPSTTERRQRPKLFISNLRTKDPFTSFKVRVLTCTGEFNEESPRRKIISLKSPSFIFHYYAKALMHHVLQLETERYSHYVALKLNLDSHYKLSGVHL